LSRRDTQHEELYRSLQTACLLLDDGDRRGQRPHDLTPTQFALLRHLKVDGPAEAAGRPIIRLAQVMLCTRGNVTRLVKRLADAGLVRTGPDPSDQRLVRVHLTTAGADLLEAAEEAHLAVNRRRFAALPPSDLRALKQLLATLCDVLTKDLEDA
jgi:MarR family transcriptional regulator, 2-MHQ and catechol-resistance regulon repressor